ncbi:MAG: acyl-CoA desaturase [Euryarchaeota archaeon]|nr:acyl-CoA desaturase [Euryarchaeota archaeon]
MTESNAVKINWLNSIFLFATPVFALIGIVLHWIYFGPPGLLELIVFVGLYFACGLSITVGYHRLFSHRSHNAKWPLVLFYSIFGAGSFQNSIIEWCSDHRRHHKLTDTEDDPYSASKGFWYSHIGWILLEEENFSNDFSNVKDLQRSKIIMWQHRNVFLIGALSGLVLPAVIGFAMGGLSGAVGCFVWAGLARVVFVHHGTFLINSAAHIWGTQPYSEENSSRDSFWLAFLTFGEGYHNFHHTFQADYRNGHKWYHMDPSKWWIQSFKYLGLNSDLKSTPKHSIEIAKVNMRFKKRADRLQRRNVNIHRFEDRLTKCKENLRAKMYEIQKAKRDIKKMAKDSKITMKNKISELKDSIKMAKDDLRQLFKEMNAEYKQAKTTA